MSEQHDVRRKLRKEAKRRGVPAGSETERWVRLRLESELERRRRLDEATLASLIAGGWVPDPSRIRAQLDEWAQQLRGGPERPESSAP